MIERNIGVNVSGIARRQLAESSYETALKAIGRTSGTPWNKATTTFDLTSGTSEYIIGEDILTDHDNTRGIISLWHTDTREYRIWLYGVEEFNSYARGSDSTGRPYAVCIRNNANRQMLLEFYPEPDSDYTIWAHLRMPLALSDIPDEYSDMVAWVGIMHANSANSPYFAKAAREIDRIMDNLIPTDYKSIEATRIIPELQIGGPNIKHKKNDSGNIWGLI